LVRPDDDISDSIVILKRFEFSSSLQRMSVIAKKKNEEVYTVYSKGSPEAIHDLCL